MVAVCVAGATAAAAAVGVIALNRDGRQEPAPVADRFALSEVAQRYRALGAELLEGAMSPPGPTSRLSCQIELTEELDGLVVRCPEEQI